MAVKTFDKRFRRDADQFAFPFVDQVRGRDNQCHLIGTHFLPKAAAMCDAMATADAPPRQVFPGAHLTDQQDAVTICNPRVTAAMTCFWAIVILLQAVLWSRRPIPLTIEAVHRLNLALRYCASRGLLEVINPAALRHLPSRRLCRPRRAMSAWSSVSGGWWSF